MLGGVNVSMFVDMLGSDTLTCQVVLPLMAILIVHCVLALITCLYVCGYVKQLLITHVDF